MLLAQDEDGEPLDVVELVRAERRVVEPAPQVRVAVFEECDLAAVHPGEDLDVDLRERRARLGVRHAELAVVLDHLQSERVREVRLRAPDAAGFDLDQDVARAEARRQVELVLSLVLRQLDDKRLVRADVGELPGVRLHERVPREEELDVHEVEVHAAFLDILVVEPDALRLDGEFDAGLGRGEAGLALSPVLFIDDGRLRAFDLVKLREDIKETLLPLRHGVAAVALGDPARTLRIAREEVEVRRHVVVLHPRRDALAVDALEDTARLGHAILKEHVVRDRHQVVVIERRAMTEHVHQAVVLREEAVVHDRAPLAEPVRARVHERLVFHVLVRAPDDGVDGEERRVDVATALVHEAVDVLQVLPHDRRPVVVDAV